MIATFNPREILAAAPDAVAIGAGARLIQPHPLAAELSLRDIATACGVLNRKRGAHESDIAVMGRGMATSDFSRVLADGVRSIMLATYGSQAEHLAFTVLQEVTDFKPLSVPMMEADVDLEPLTEGAEIARFNAVLSVGSRTVELRAFARAISISRQAIINNQMFDIGRVFGSIGGSGARLEARMVAAEMESNPTLDDGEVVFDAKYTNILGDAGSPAALVPTNLGLAMGLLRTQLTASGQRADLKAKHLVVEPGLELIARSMVRDAALDVVVSVLANLPIGRWYLLADPAACPTVGVLRLLGAKTPLRVEQKKSPMDVDGARVTASADLGAVMLGRVGIVRGG